MIITAQNHNYNQTLPPSWPAPDHTLNYRPVIGIVSHPGDGATGRLSNATNVSYIAASYVKFAEMGGARVIPLIYTDPPEILNQKLNLVNGIIFTGGWAKDGLYFDVIKGIFQKVLKKNDAGEHFPVLAICLGYELLTMIITNDNNILEEFSAASRLQVQGSARQLEEFSAASQASTVQFVENVNIEGTVFGRFPLVLLKKMSIDFLVMQNHHLGTVARRSGEERPVRTDSAPAVTFPGPNTSRRRETCEPPVSRDSW